MRATLVGSRIAEQYLPNVPVPTVLSKKAATCIIARLENRCELLLVKKNWQALFVLEEL